MASLRELKEKVTSAVLKFEVGGVMRDSMLLRYSVGRRTWLMTDIMGDLYGFFFEEIKGCYKSARNYSHSTFSLITFSCHFSFLNVCFVHWSEPMLKPITLLMEGGIVYTGGTVSPSHQFWCGLLCWIALVPIRIVLAFYSPLTYLN